MNLPALASQIPTMCCGLVECLGRTPEATGNCTRATSIYSLTSDLVYNADLLKRADRHAKAGRTWKEGNLRANVAERLANFDNYAPYVIARLPECTGNGGAGGACNGETEWDALTSRLA